MKKDEITVSIVMPVYNEETYIESCIDSLLTQTYPKEKMEWLFVDGQSEDKTKSLIQAYIDERPNLISVFDNPMRTAPHAMNIGIKQASGKYIIRLDAHAEYPTEYIERCVRYLDETDADNVGGLAVTESQGFVGGAIAKMLSSKFGVGNSQFRTDGNSGYVDTVPFGAFRREVFTKYGLYDERLTRNQDNEMNYRIRKNGGKIYLASDIHFTYYCRDTVKGINAMGRKNGFWNVITMKLCPGAMGIRHFVPMLFLMSLILGPILASLHSALMLLFGLELLAYVLIDLFESTRLGETLREKMLLSILFPLFHINYGYGSLKGIMNVMFNKKWKVA